MKITLNRICARFLLVFAALLAAVLLMPPLQAFASLPTVDETLGRELRPKGACIVLSSYSIVKGSSNDTLTVRITLTNASVYDARSILVSFRDLSNTVMPVYGTSNQFYIASLPKLSSVESEIQLAISGLTKNDAFILNFTLDFNDVVVGAEQNTFYIGSSLSKTLPAVHPVSIDAIGSPDDTGKTPVKFALQNQLDYPVQNVELLLKGTLENETVQRIPIGTIKQKEKLEVEHSLALPEGRVQQVLVSLAYQDKETMTVTTQEQPFTLYRYQSAPVNAQQQGSINPFGQNWKKAAVYLVLIFVVIVVWIIISRKRRLT